MTAAEAREISQKMMQSKIDAHLIKVYAEVKKAADQGHTSCKLPELVGMGVAEAREHLVVQGYALTARPFYDDTFISW